MQRRHSRRAVLGMIGAFSLGGCLDSDESSDSSESSEASEPSNSTSEQEDPDNSTTTEPNTEIEEVVFQSAADTEIEGTVYGTSDCGVVLTPQINLDRDSWEPQAQQLVENGYMALAINEDEDNRPESVLGAAHYLSTERDLQNIVFIGASSGGEASVIANAQADLDSVAGVVALSPGGGADYAADLQGQKLFVVAEDDEERFVRTVEKLHDQASEPKSLQRYSGSSHGQRLFDSNHQEDLLEQILTLMADACE